MRSTVVVLLALLYALAGVVSLTYAQAQAPAPVTAAGDKGSIIGTAMDTTGAVVPGVVVTSLDAAGQAQTTTSDEKGEYRIDGLVPGVYKLVVEVPGFKSLTLEGITVKAGEAVRADLKLVPAAAESEKIEVTAGGAAQVEQETAQLAGTFTNKEVTTYGLNGRNFTQLIALAPGVSNQTGQDEALVGVKGSVNYSVNGGRVEYNTYDVDGGDILNASINRSSSTLIVYPSIDAINELQVLTSNYGAMYGRSASGTILATTKAGGPTFHGDGYFFARNNIFNARNFFDQTKRAPLYEKYEPGGTIGGPLYIPGVYNRNKDKTFFFFSEEYRHDKEPVEFNQGVPSLTERNCADPTNTHTWINPDPTKPPIPIATSAFCQTPTAPGMGLPSGAVRYADFSDVCPQVGPPGQPGNTGYFALTPGIPSPNGGKLPVYPDCPSVGQVNTGSPNSPFQTYPGNLVPISAQSAAILDTNLISLPNATSGCNTTIGSCYNAAVSPLTTWRQELFRIDQNFTPTQKLSFRYIHDAWSTQVPYVQWGFVHNSLPTVENNFVGPGLSLVAHYTATIKSRLVNDVVMAYTSDHINLTDFAGPGVANGSLARPAILNNAPCNNAPTCGLGYIFDNTANNFGGKIPGLVIGGNNAAYGGNGFSIDPGYLPWHHSNPTYSPRDDATLALGKHTLQFGALFIIAQRNEVNPPVGATTGDIQGLATFSNVNSRGSSGNAYADFLAGNIQSFTQDSSQGVYHNDYKIAEPYLQDNWKVLPNLTLNLGVRLSIFGLYAEKYHQSFNWVPSQFSTSVASGVVVDPQTGRLLTAGGQSIPIDPSNPSPLLLNGIVQCGVGTYTNGQKVPSGCMTDHFLNTAPRIGVAWDPFKDGKTSVRAGYGIFYEHGTGNEANTGSLEGSAGPQAAGGVLSMTQFYPGSWGCIGDLLSSCNSNPLLCYQQNCSRSAFPLNVTAIPTKVVWPYVQQWSLSVQRQLPGDLLASVAYVGSKGTHLSTELQVNQLLPLNQVNNPFLPGQPLTNFICLGEGAPFFTINGANYGPGSAPYQTLLAACAGMNPNGPSANSIRIPGSAIAPGMGQIFSLMNVANSNYHAMQFTLRRTRGPLTLGVSYTYSHSIDDSSDRFSQVFVNAYDIGQNRASSDFDQRHLVNVSYIYELPFEKWYRALNFADDDSTNQLAGNGISDGTKAFLRGWEWAGITIFSTGTPFSVINGGSPTGISTADNAGVLAVIGPGSYPDVVRLPTASSPVKSFGGSLFGPILGNPGQFVAPEGLTYGNAGRNFFRNPGRLNFDMSITKNITMNENRILQFRFETFNVFNHTQFRIYDPANPGNPGNNVVNCYGSSATNYSAGDPSCLQSSSFLHPVDAHRPRTVQLGVKYLF